MTDKKEALQRVMEDPAITMEDLAALMGVHKSTLTRRASKDNLPVPVARIGQRWIVPSIPVRKFLHLDDVA